MEPLQGDLIASICFAPAFMVEFPAMIDVDDAATFIEKYRSHKQKKQNLVFA